MARVTSMGPRLTSRDVDLLEERLGQRLPDDYRSFLLRTNGGVPEPRDIDAIDGSGEWSINVILGLTRQIQSSNIESTVRDVRETIPSGYLPIAAGDTGEIFLLAVNGPRLGSVVVWQWQEDDLSTSRRTLHPVGRSFSDFLQRIREL